MKRILCAVAWALFALIGVHGSARADWLWTSTSYPEIKNHPSAESACQAILAKLGGYTYGGLTYIDASTFQCRPAGGMVMRTGTPCVAPKVYNSATGACEAPPGPECTSGRTFEQTFRSGTGSLSSDTANKTDDPIPSNVGGCSVDLESVVECYSVAGATEKTFYCKYRLKETGAQAPTSSTPSEPSQPATDAPKAPAVDSAPPAPDGSCPAGTVRIGTDSAGTPMCAGTGTSPTQPGSTTTTKPPVTTTNPDGSTTKTEVTERLNSDGSTSTTTTTTTTAPNGTVTTSSGTITGNRPDGGQGTPDGDPEKSDFCKQNPTLTVCQNSTISGSCEATACTGDAITCEIARQQRLANCRHKEEMDALNASPLKLLGDQIAAGNDPLKSTLPGPGNASVVNVPGLNSTGFLSGGGTCLNDKAFNAGGMQFVIPFSSVCEHLEPMRYVMLIIGALISLKLLRSSIFA